MIVRGEFKGPISPTSRERISYVKQMLGELSQVARADMLFLLLRGEAPWPEQAELLVYLLEMAFQEAGDILGGRSNGLSHQVNRHEAARMPVKPAGQV